VFLATLICSDERCAQEIELTGADVGVLAGQACDCGCTLVLLAVSDWEPARLPMLV